jgi:hypothetical protein|tara:strand:- start:8416 stop:8808 length:393 start_codon:yes stop_codon:yes gene_type:complete
MEMRYVNPSYVLVGITGLALVDRSGRDFTTPWVITSIVVFLVVTAIGGAVYAPLLRRQIMLAEENYPDSAEYRRLDLRGNIIGLAIVALVVFQPALWKYPSVAILSGAKYLVTKMQIIAAQGQILHRSSE